MIRSTNNVNITDITNTAMMYASVHILSVIILIVILSIFMILVMLMVLPFLQTPSL